MFFLLKDRKYLPLIVLCSLFIFTGCMQDGTGSSQPGSTAEDRFVDIARPSKELDPKIDTQIPHAVSSDGVLGETCHSSDPEHLCLALKYLVYQNSEGHPVVSPRQALRNLSSINKIWSACDIAFQIDNYAPEDPKKKGLVFNTANETDLDLIRSTYSDDTSLLVVTTGSWDRDGSLGNTGANAWTTLPGHEPYGAVLEAPVGTFSNIIAHEIGHYLNLDHNDESTNLMSPTIYDESTQLGKTQCDEAREITKKYWAKMIR